MSVVDAYLHRMGRLAREMGSELTPVTPAERDQRLSEVDVALVERGFETGLLMVEGRNRVRTADPHQRMAWLIEGTPARLRWDRVPHLAAYVEMVEHLRHPANAVRFETPHDELSLDLAALSPEGDVLVLGAVAHGVSRVDEVERLIPTFGPDAGPPPGSSDDGSPLGSQRDAWRVAHQLWETRAPYLWLVATETRVAFDVTYGDGIGLRSRDFLPLGRDLWEHGYFGPTPRVRRADALA
jgi:hypothetical protein